MYDKIAVVGVIELENVVVSKNLVVHIISSQINDLVAVVNMFSDNINDLEDNLYVKQNDILVKMLKNINSIKKNKIQLSYIYKSINEEEKSLIDSLKLEEKIIHNYKLSNHLGVENFDIEKFISVLDKEIDIFSSKYNLRANDDYNKLMQFLISIRASINASDDKLMNLVNQYEFFSNHGEMSLTPEYISLYGSKVYKYDLLKGIISKYINIDQKECISKSEINKKR